MSNTTKKRKAYDPAKQWGLKPEGDTVGATYVIAGHVARGGSGAHAGDIAENMGREAQAKAQRRLAKDSDKMLKSLLDRDKDGMKAVMTAREFMSKQEAAAKNEKPKRKEHKTDVLVSKTNVTKNSFDAETVKRLGFDPTSKPGHRQDADDKMQEKVGLSLLLFSFSYCSSSLTDSRPFSHLEKTYLLVDARNPMFQLKSWKKTKLWWI